VRGGRGEAAISGHRAQAPTRRLLGVLYASKELACDRCAQAAPGAVFTAASGSGVAARRRLRRILAAIRAWDCQRTAGGPVQATANEPTRAAMMRAPS